MYHIIRINYKMAVEAHSVEHRATYREAAQRYHNIIAADLGNQAITYCMTLLLDENLDFVENEPPFVYNQVDENNDPIYPFEFAVIREFIKENTLNSSVEYKQYEEAYKRYFNIIAADLQDSEETYNCAMMIQPDGGIREKRYFNRS